MSLPKKLADYVKKYKKQVFSEGYEENFKTLFARCLSEGYFHYSIDSGQEKFLKSCSRDQLDKLIQVMVDDYPATISDFYVLFELKKLGKPIEVRKVEFFIHHQGDSELESLREQFFDAERPTSKLKNDISACARKLRDDASDELEFCRDMIELCEVFPLIDKNQFSESHAQFYTEKAKSLYERSSKYQERDSHNLFIKLESALPESLKRSVVMGENTRNQIAVAKAAGKILRNSNIAGGLTVAGAAVLLSTLGALSPTMSSLIVANPVSGGCVLALILLVGAALTAVGSVHAHAARTGKSVKELFVGSGKEKQHDAGEKLSASSSS